MDSISNLLSSFHAQSASLFLTFFNLRNNYTLLVSSADKVIFATTCNLVFEDLVGE